MTGLFDDRCRKMARRWCKGGGRFVSRCAEECPRCACGVWACEMRAARDAPTLTAIERFVVAGFVAPRLRSGAFPRKIKVFDASGAVTREITGEDLGKALLGRVDIECSAPVPPTVCPKCGGGKYPRAKTCMGCSPNAPVDGRTPVCSCGRRKRNDYKKCCHCRRATRKTKGRLCPCGSKKTAYASACRSCAGVPTPMTDEDRARVARMYASGSSLVDIARLVGTSRTTVFKIIKKSGVSRGNGTTHRREARVRVDVEMVSKAAALGSIKRASLFLGHSERTTRRLLHEHGYAAPPVPRRSRASKPC